MQLLLARWQVGYVSGQGGGACNRATLSVRARLCACGAALLAPSALILTAPCCAYPRGRPLPESVGICVPGVWRRPGPERGCSSFWLDGRWAMLAGRVEGLATGRRFRFVRACAPAELLSLRPQPSSLLLPVAPTPGAAPSRSRSASASQASGGGQGQSAGHVEGDQDGSEDDEGKQPHCYWFSPCVDVETLHVRPFGTALIYGWCLSLCATHADVPLWVRGEAGQAPSSDDIPSAPSSSSSSDSEGEHEARGGDLEFEALSTGTGVRLWPWAGGTSKSCSILAYVYIGHA